MEENLDIKGKIAMYEIPEWSDEELRYYWEPETEQGPDGLWRIVRPARISNGEKRSRKVLEVDNLLTNAGLITVLYGVSLSSQVGMPPFAQIFSVGNGAITHVIRQDTSVAGDGFTTGARKVPASFSIVGFTTTITINFGAGDAVGTWTNCGFYSAATGMGGPFNASITPGSGVLSTHALLNVVKGSSPYAAAYTISLSN